LDKLLWRLFRFELKRPAIRQRLVIIAATPPHKDG
jgi:hypothetical protein